MTKQFRTVALVYDVKKPMERRLFRQWPGEWPRGSSLVGNSFFVPPVDGKFDADWLICGTPPTNTINTSVPFDRRVFLVQEPPDYWSVSDEILSNFRWIICPYQTSEKSPQILTRYVPIQWWYGLTVRSSGGHQFGPEALTFKQIESEPQPKKLNKMSTIVSAKSFLAGHRKRLAFTLKLKEALGDFLDIYGHGFREVPDKRDALLGYKYHFAAENAVLDHWWTEKVDDPLLARCRTFYCGASRISDYFESDAVLPLDIDEIDKSIEKIKRAIENDDVNSGAIERARHDILYKYNFPFYIDSLLGELELRS